MSESIHWKKLHNPDYLGAYSLEQGKDMILTVKTVKNEVVQSADGKKEECMVMTFQENVKPMILNATNAKAIEKLYKTPYINLWEGKKIQLFVDKVKAFGDVVEALRIRQYMPKQTVIVTKCTDCEQDIKPFGKMDSIQLSQYTHQKYGKSICSDCAAKIGKTEVVENVNE